MPDLPAFGVAAFEHVIDPTSGDDLGAIAVLLYEHVCGSPDVEVGNQGCHRLICGGLSSSLATHRRRSWAYCSGNSLRSRSPRSRMMRSALLSGLCRNSQSFTVPSWKENQSAIARQGIRRHAIAQDSGFGIAGQRIRGSGSVAASRWGAPAMFRRLFLAAGIAFALLGHASGRRSTEIRR